MNFFSVYPIDWPDFETPLYANADGDENVKKTGKVLESAFIKN